MFRITPSQPPNLTPHAPLRSQQTVDFDDNLEDVLMGEDFEGEGPSRAAAVGGGGRVTGPGEAIADSGRWMRGHGTYVQDDKVLASVAGTLERVNKLVSVRPLRTKYRPEVGDLVLGRIVEVGPRRWKVEAHAAQHAVLMLSSINLPGGVQRRKLESDELQMRTFFAEGDLLVAEVQAFFGDGAMSLHTRSLKYGKLKNGQLVVVPPQLIVRAKSHFHSLPKIGVDLIIGLNGYVWVSKTIPRQLNAEGEEVGFGEESGEGVYSGINEDIDSQTRLAITKVALLLGIFASYSVPISVELVQEAYEVASNVVGEGVEGVQRLRRKEVAEQVLRALAMGRAE